MPKIADKSKLEGVGLAGFAKNLSAQLTRNDIDPTLVIKSTKDKLPEFIPSPSLILDYMIRSKGVIGGLPMPGLIEVYGLEGVGKTTFAGLVAVEFQSRSHPVVYIDAERKMNLDYMTEMGLNISNPETFLLLQPLDAEQAFDMTESAIIAGAKLVVIDSWAALSPKQEINTEYGDATPGTMGRMGRQAIRKLLPIIVKHKATLLVINQVYDKIGVMYGSPEETVGGKGLRYYATVRVRISKDGSKTGTLVKDGEAYGHIIRLELKKNGWGKNGIEPIVLPLIYGQGIDRAFEIAKLSSDLGLLEKSGNWITLPGTSYKFNGVEKFSEALADDDALADELTGRITKLIAERGTPEPEAPVAAD